MACVYLCHFKISSNAKIFIVGNGGGVTIFYFIVCDIYFLFGISNDKFLKRFKLSQYQKSPIL